MTSLLYLQTKQRKTNSLQNWQTLKSKHFKVGQTMRGIEGDSHRDLAGDTEALCSWTQIAGTSLWVVPHGRLYNISVISHMDDTRSLCDYLCVCHLLFFQLSSAIVGQGKIRSFNTNSDSDSKYVFPYVLHHQLLNIFHEFYEFLRFIVFPLVFRFVLYLTTKGLYVAIR